MFLSPFAAARLLHVRSSTCSSLRWLSTPVIEVPKKLGRKPAPKPDQPPPTPKPRAKRKSRLAQAEAPDAPVTPVPRIHVPTPPEMERLPPLPPVELWREHFPSSIVVRERSTLNNPASAMRVARSFIDNPQTRTDQPKVVIEAFPGPGMLSRALLALPPSKLRKLIILEDHKPYLKYLNPLAEADSRVVIVPQSGFSWQTYSFLEEQGLIDVEPFPWGEKIHPELHFVSHLPQSIPGEQLIAQLFRCIPERSWLFKYGRVPMSFLFPDWVWRRLNAPPPAAERCKLSVIAEATADFRLSLPAEHIAPYEDHFHPVYLRKTDHKPEGRRPGAPINPVNIVPHADQFIDKGKLEAWDYILRRLFVLKSTPLRLAISSLAPGANVLLKTLTDPRLPATQRVDINQMIKTLSISDWTLVARAFDDWPFAPEDLMIDSFVNQFDER